ncbi:ExbD/TolR family protein [Winogradskyella alexanderae]|uniref:Uncharacterized protein n=1 Tax=Winogradskyella alexanderae TaxID=2877123 RepID=A0ABS7XUF0_9FLAO|nr:hypothetical protein [Winogradskyella alexanderae]MCA0133653.1 hypothetical protein [Winogradskyella alexanderae]
MSQVRKVCFLAILICVSLDAQIKSINLPLGDDEIKISRIVPIVSIYVDSKDRVYIEYEPVNTSSIAKKLTYTRFKLPRDIQRQIKIFLYIDNKANYKIVDEIKSQLASAYFERIYYKTNSIEDKDILVGLSWTNYYSFYHLEFPQKILTKKQKERNKRFNDSLQKAIGMDFFPPPPPPPPASWFFESRQIIYSDSKNAIEEVLENKDYSCYTLTNKGFKRGDEIIKFKNKDKVDELFHSYDVVFIKFSKDLKYENYFHAIELYKNLKTDKKGYFFELSHEINEIHSNSNINLCY